MEEKDDTTLRCDDDVKNAIQAWLKMTTELKLKGATLRVFAAIYSRTNSITEVFHGTIEELAKATYLPRWRVWFAMKALKRRRLFGLK